MVNATDFFSEADYWDAVYEETEMPATAAEADYEYARNVGMDHPERCWILSDRDVWYRNPSYRGPVQPHPEDDRSEEDLLEWTKSVEQADQAREAAKASWLASDEDIPF